MNFQDLNSKLISAFPFLFWVYFIMQVSEPEQFYMSFLTETGGRKGMGISKGWEPGLFFPLHFCTSQKISSWATLPLLCELQYMRWMRSKA